MTPWSERRREVEEDAEREEFLNLVRWVAYGYGPLPWRRNRPIGDLRRRVLEELRGGPLELAELAERVGRGRPQVSRILGALREVRRVARGLWELAR